MWFAIFLLIIGLVAVLVIFWLRRCIVVIRTGVMKEEEVPVQAVITRFGRPVKVIGPGLYFLKWPIERIEKLFPTIQYVFDYTIEKVHTKETQKQGTAPLRVDITLYYKWAQVGKKYRAEEIGRKISREIDGAELLKRYAYFGFGGDPLKPEQVKDFFKDAVVGGTRTVMAKRNHKECREEKAKIEEEVKDYLLSEPGNPFFECGTPARHLDLEVRTISFPEQMEKAFYVEEVAEKEKAAMEKTIEAFTEMGINPVIAGILAKKSEEGKGIGFRELAELGIGLSFLGIQPNKKGDD